MKKVTPSETTIVEKTKCTAGQDAPSAGEQSAQALVEGVDFVMENGFFVLTREYLMSRGSCCGSGCRNCPYGT